ncbi:inner membrane protein [Serratia plymuthica]|uniref:UPF0056 membrane protein n=1 Tax=Serratia plymuthica TaxID=82996 RepID=A0A2X4UIK0_SERPL|nr:inner membrane protein [Serratia plymuthica]
MSSIMQLFQAIGLGLVLLLPLANPLTTVALLLGLSGNMTREERNQQSLMASIYVFLIMTVAFYAGQLVMNTFGISIPGLRIAGGLIVAFIGFRMLFPQQSAEDAPEVETKSNELRKRTSANIAFVPLAMPSTAGPGRLP